MKYFLRIDYIYRCSPVQRVRTLVDSILEVRRYLHRYSNDDYMVLSVRVERCQ